MFELPVLLSSLLTGWTLTCGGLLPALVDAGVGWLLSSAWQRRAERYVYVLLFIIICITNRLVCERERTREQPTFFFFFLENRTKIYMKSEDKDNKNKKISLSTHEFIPGLLSNGSIASAQPMPCFSLLDDARRNLSLETVYISPRRTP